VPLWFFSWYSLQLADHTIQLLSLKDLLTNQVLYLNCAYTKWRWYSTDFSLLTVNYSPPKLVILHMNMALHVYDDIMRMTENLSEKYIIGYGASSTVYKCVLKNCKPVAIKKLYSHYPQCLKEFETELETVGSIKHRNLVSLQGYSLSPFGNLLFYDYMENGSLWDLLHGKLKLFAWKMLIVLHTLLQTFKPSNVFVYVFQDLPRRKNLIGMFV